jgi:hypothetical protein
MSLIDNIDKWIIKMFKFNERETGGTNAAYYPEGIKVERITTEEDLVYGQFTSDKKIYYFTNTSLVIDNGQPERIKIEDITATNGSFRSEHKMIYVKAAGKKLNIKISDFPYRIQQLFYQLIENHGSLIKVPMFAGLTRLAEYASDLAPEDLSKFNLSVDTHTVVKSIELDQILYHGVMRNNTIFPDEIGVLIIKGYIGKKEIIIFNSQTDGYNGVTEYYAERTKTVPFDFEELKNDVTRLILQYNYSIENCEFEELKTEIGLKSIKEINNLFSYIILFIESEGQLTRLTEFETQ